MESFLFEWKFPLWDLWLTPFGPIVDHSSELQFGLGLESALDLDTIWLLRVYGARGRERRTG